MSHAVVDPNRRIIVIDKSRDTRRDFRSILMPSFEVDSALPGEFALQRVERSTAVGKPYGVAFVDMGVPPGSDAVEAVGQIWQLDPTLQIVLYTASMDEFDRELLNGLNRTDQCLMLQKPFGRAELLRLAGAMSERWRHTRETRLRLAALEKNVAELHDQNRRLENSKSRWGPKQTSKRAITPAPRAKIEIDNLASVVVEGRGEMEIRDISTSGIGVIIPSKAEKGLIDTETGLTIQIADGVPIQVNGVFRHLADLNDLEACAGFQFLDLGMENFCRIRDYVDKQLEH